MASLVVRFTAAGLVVMAALAVLIAFLARDAGTEQAENTAREVTLVIAEGVAEPALTADLLAGDPEALESFNDLMQSVVLRGSLVRVKVWDAQGRIVYSDDPRLIGSTYDLGTDEQLALGSGQVDSGISDLSEPENRFERSYDKLLEVYVGVQTEAGVRLLFEAYYRYDAVSDAGQAQWRQFAPAALGGLVVLQLVQIPFAWSLARRVQHQQRDGVRLLRHAVDASDAERRRIAADLHDGIVQQLTGLTFALDAARLGGPDGPRDRELIGDTARALRGCVGELRSLMVDIYPPNLAEEGLPAALAELAVGLGRTGLQVDLDADGAADLPLTGSAVLFRSAQELLRNVATHSGARSVQVTATADGATARLVVDDDGRGFEALDAEDRLRDGHLGLRSLGDLVAESGGTLTVRSAAGQGTRVEVVVPQ